MSDSRPYPWLTHPPVHDPLAGWRFVDVVDGGLPVIPRYHFSRSRDDLPLRALLGQPLILYGHHEDVADSLTTLSDAAAQIDALGNVRWCSLGEIARSNYETRRNNSLLEVRMSASVVDLDVPEGVDTLVVSATPMTGVQVVELADTSGVTKTPFTTGSTEMLPIGPGRVQLRAIRGDLIDPSVVPSPRLRAWPMLRRSASELRDRLQPAKARVNRR